MSGLLTNYITGVGSVTGGQLNTFCQSCDNFAVLRSFVGASGIEVFARGQITPNDGYQGFFYWNATGSSPDDNNNYIVPYGASSGEWVRQTSETVHTVFTVPTIAALRLATTVTVPASSVNVIQYQSNIISGGGTFVYNPDDTTSADDGGIIIVDGSGRRWWRQDGAGGETFDMAWFGANETLLDNTAALNLALAYLQAASTGSLVFGAGAFTFLSPISFTFPSSQCSISISGRGADVTVLNWPSGSGLSFVCSSAQHSVHLRDMTIATSTVASAGAVGVSVSNSIQGGLFGQSDFEDLTFRGADDVGTFQWGTALQITGLSNVNYYGCLFLGLSSGAGGNGIVLAGVPAGAFKLSVVHNITSCGFFNLNVGLTDGTYVQGVQIASCNFTNGNTGIYVPPGVADPAELAVTLSQFNVAGNGINVAGGMPQLSVSDCDFYVPAPNSGVSITGACINSQITGNSFSGLTAAVGTGVYVNNLGNANVITGNTFYGLAQGVLLGTASTGWNVQSNGYANNTTNTTNSGSFNTIGGGSA
jgi:hypothetical protein